MHLATYCLYSLSTTLRTLFPGYSFVLYKDGKHFISFLFLLFHALVIATCPDDPAKSSVTSVIML